MRNNLTALFLSLLIHAIIFTLLFLRFAPEMENIYKPPRMGVQNGERVSLKQFKFKPGSQAQQQATASAESKASVESKASIESAPQIAQKPIPQQQTPQEQEKQPLKERGKTAQIKPQRATEQKQPPKREQQPKLASKAAPSSRKSQESKGTQREPSLSSQTLAAHSPSIYDYGKNEQTQKIRELYGEEFGALTPNQQKFIKSNLDTIGRITQRYLKYPAVAGRIGQEGDNVLEFYLYPNGDISDLRLLSTSGYTLLDDNSLHTIKIAYKDYPYPNEKTKIRIRVMYRIY